MERQQQAQKSVNLEATLIGRRTVPKGCRVLNVSQQGISLQCDPDGRLLTFNNGDSVDIYLSAHHADGHNKFTIPAIVSHVDENTVDVVFHCTDAELAGLIDSYRTSEAHKLEASIGHRKKSPQVTKDIPAPAHEAGTEGQNIATNLYPSQQSAFIANSSVRFVSKCTLLRLLIWI